MTTNYNIEAMTDAMNREVADRLAYLRSQIEDESISMYELVELQDLGEQGLIPDDDLLLREWAGIPEGDIWTITIDGDDSLGQIVMVRINGRPHTRAFSMSEARHLLRRYQDEQEE